MNISTHVISLNTEIARRKNIEEQLNNLGLKFDFFDAIDLRDTNINDLKNYIIEDNDFNKPSRVLTKGEVGCALSHFTLLSTLRNKKSFDAFLILEDDAILSPQFYDFISSVKLKSFDWDVIILGYSKLSKEEFSSFYIKEPIRNKNKINNVNIGKVWREWTCGTVAYLINPRCLNKFDDINISSVADDWDYLSKKLNLIIYHVRPLLVEEDFLKFTSSIELDRAKLIKKNRSYLNSYRYARGVLRKIIMGIKNN